MATATAQSEAPADDELLDDDEPVLEFNTTASAKPRATKRFKLDGRVVTATAPKAAAWARMWAAGASGDSQMTCYVWFQFVDACLGPEIAAWLRKRETDPDDPYDIKDLVNLVKFLNAQFEADLKSDFETMGVVWQQADVTVPDANRATRRKSATRKPSSGKSATARKAAAARR